MKFWILTPLLLAAACIGRSQPSGSGPGLQGQGTYSHGRQAEAFRTLDILFREAYAHWDSGTFRINRIQDSLGMLSGQYIRTLQEPNTRLVKLALLPQIRQWSRDLGVGAVSLSSDLPYRQVRIGTMARTLEACGIRDLQDLRLSLAPGPLTLSDRDRLHRIRLIYRDLVFNFSVLRALRGLGREADNAQARGQAGRKSLRTYYGVP